MRKAIDRLTPLGVVVLALLREGPMHPYEMLRLLRQRHKDRVVAIANGTFYHTVVRLEGVGLLSEVGVDRDGNRPERTTYALTDEGYEIVGEWVRRELPRVDRPAEFRVALAEAHNLPRDEVVALLAVRRELLITDLAAQRAALARTQAKGIPAQFVIDTEREEIILAAEVAWVDALISRLASREIPWGWSELAPATMDALRAHREALTT
ncbi:MAG: PadR family transcriptional regulator [Microbacterium sp.]